MRLERLARSGGVIGLTSLIVLETARACVKYHLAFWDAQIWATAKLNQIPMVPSEDFPHPGRIEGVEFLNPFQAAIPGET